MAARSERLRALLQGWCCTLLVLFAILVTLGTVWFVVVLAVTVVLKCTVGVAQLCCGASGGAASRIARLVLALPVGAYLLLRIVGVVPLNPTWDWIAFGAALLLLPCGVFEACGDAPQNRGEALTLACVPCYVFFVAGELPEWMNPARVVAWVSGAPLRRAVRTAPNNRARRAASADDDDAVPVPVPAALDRV